MRINPKYFVVGALIALLPLVFYAETKLNPKKAEAIKYESVVAYNDLHTEPKPTSIPVNTSVPVKATVVPTIAVPTVKSEPKTAVYELHQSGAPGHIVALVQKYSAEYGVDAQMMLGIAKCESGYRENALNGPYAGLYQFVSTTWISNRRALGMETDPQLRLNAEESIRTAAFKMSRDGFGAWPVCQYKAQALISSSN